MASAGLEQLLAAHRRGSKPAQPVAPPSFVGLSALARAAAAGNRSLTDPETEQPDEFVPELEEPASAEPATLEDESESERLSKSRDPLFTDEVGVVNLVRKDGDDGEAVGVG